MDELATTVSNILNQAAGGVGDISQWLATNGLPGYAAVNIAQNTAVCLIAVALIVASAFGIRALVTNDAIFEDDEMYVLIFIVSCVVFCGSMVILCLTIPDLVGWLASPDGMLLKTLVSALTN